jgi:ubiquinone/menaquinone biosynthesis C-methylase UbiE
MTVYNSIGQSYAKFRRPDPRIVDSIINLLQLEKGSLIADIGAGTGNYSRAIAERGFFVQAVEPSLVMRQQATEHPQVQWFAGYAEELPLATASVDAVICILASHHFSNLEQAIKEMHRVTKKGALVFLTFDPAECENFWLLDYFPSFREYDLRLFSSINNVANLIATHTSRKVEISTFLLPPDLTDMFAAAGWKQPKIYLDPEVRACISAFALADANVVERGINLLKEDLNSGRWNAIYGEIKQLQEIDLGYRFLRAILD